MPISARSVHTKREGRSMGNRRYREVPLHVSIASVLVLLLLDVQSFCGEQPATGTRLGIQGTEFTLNDRPTFLLGVSYYAGLGASEDTVRQDLNEMRRRGFNWIRVWVTWGAFDNDVSAVDAEGNPREPFLGRLQRLVEECDRRGMVVDVTLSRGNGVTGPPRLQSLEAHRRAVESIVAALKPRANWYLDLSNERNIRDRRYADFADLRALRTAVRRLDPQRLVTASHAGDISREDLGQYLRTVEVDFLSPHRPRHAGSPRQTAEKTRELLAWMKEMGRAVPVHYQEPFRRGFSGRWEPLADDFAVDLRQARTGGAAGWCFHNGDQRTQPDGQPRRSFDLRRKRLFEQLDDEERVFLDRRLSDVLQQTNSGPKLSGESMLVAPQESGNPRRGDEWPQRRGSAPAAIIFDTDMDTDCDDAGALAMLHAMADAGEVEILATMVSSRHPWSVPCVAAINGYYGRGALPIGCPKGPGAPDLGSRYARQIAQEFPAALKSNADAPAASGLYRKILAARRDGEVVVVTVGDLTNLRDLLATSPDEHSPLAGRELVRRKVKGWVCMGGRYPRHLDPTVYGNFKPDPVSTVAAVANWPTTIYFTGLGDDILTGEPLRQTPRGNPVRRAYELYLGTKPTRPSWDPIAVLFAVRGCEPFFQLHTKGYNHIFPNGTNLWRDAPDKNHVLIQLVPGMGNRLRKTIDDLMVRSPQVSRRESPSSARPADGTESRDRRSRTPRRR